MADCDGDEMFLASEYEGPVLPWDRFRKWVTCFCVVTFDLELGQALEVSTASISFIVFMLREARNLEH